MPFLVGEKQSSKTNKLILFKCLFWFFFPGKEHQSNKHTVLCHLFYRSTASVLIFLKKAAREERLFLKKKKKSESCLDFSTLYWKSKFAYKWSIQLACRVDM